MSKAPTVKKNPADATLRNVRAAKKRDALLIERLASLESRVTALEDDARRRAELAAAERYEGV